MKFIDCNNARWKPVIKMDTRCSGTLGRVVLLFVAKTNIWARLINSIFKGQAPNTAWHMKLGLIDCPETSVNNYCVKSQKSECLIYTAA